MINLAAKFAENSLGLRYFNWRDPKLLYSIFTQTTYVVVGAIIRLLLIIKALEMGMWVFERFGPSLRVPLESGQWAVITGGSDGIGKGMALKAFLNGQNLVLVGRSKQKLEEAAAEIKLHQGSTTGSEVIIFVCDLDNLSEKKLDEFTTTLRKLKGEIGLLVNSAGVSYDSATPFEDLEVDRISTLINLNLLTTIRITQKVYQIMLDNRNQMCKGIIVCLGSGSATIPSDPLYSVYAASKAGVMGFCESLKVEGHMTKILVQCHTPLMVPSKLSKARVGPMVPSLEDYVEDAWKHICSQFAPPPEAPFFGSASCTPSFRHKLIVAFSAIIPKCLWDKMRWGQNEYTYERYLKKMADKQEKESAIKSGTEGGKIIQ